MSLHQDVPFHSDDASEGVYRSYRRMDNGNLFGLVDLSAACDTVDQDNLIER